MATGAVLEIADVVHEMAEGFTIAECTFDMAVDRLEWAETEDDEPVVMVEKRATFTGMADGAVDLTGPIPNTPKIGVAALLQPPAVTGL